MRRISSLQQKPLSKVRYLTIALILIVATIGLMWRIVYLSIFHRDFLQEQGDARTLRVLSIPAYRGMIRDRFGEPLAISTPVDAVWLNPQEFDPNHSGIAHLATLLSRSIVDIQRQANKNSEREFVYLRRGLDPAVGEKIRELNIPGIFLQREYRRFYPEGEVTAHVLGFTNIDDQGQEGLELAYNSWLSGVPGRKRVLKDRLGHVVADVSMLRAPRPGQDLILSIDRRIQYLAYRELKAGLQRYQAVAGSAIVLDVKTGEVLAMVNQPSYNPNSRPIDCKNTRCRNRAVTDLFEPASTIKTFSIISALTSGVYHPNSLIDTSPGWMIVANRRIADERPLGVVDITKILAISSNVGVSKIILSIPVSYFWRVLNAVGFGQLSGLGFPGESPGWLNEKSLKNPFVLATLSFGYGLSVTALQLAQAYLVLANEGVKKPVSLLRVDQVPVGELMLDPGVVRQVLVMLESVISRGGTAPLARIPGYRITGKTGTSRLLDEHGQYQKHHYNSSFVGLAPSSHPRLLVAVVLHDPRGKQYYGGYTAGPIFAKIMSGALQFMGVPPDNI